MTDHKIILLTTIPLLAGLLSIFFINNKKVSRLIGVFSYTMMLGLAFSLVLKITNAPESESVLVSQMGGWTAPFGISIVFDSTRTSVMTEALSTAWAMSTSTATTQWVTRPRCSTPTAIRSRWPMTTRTAWNGSITRMPVAWRSRTTVTAIAGR